MQKELWKHFVVIILFIGIGCSDDNPIESNIDESKARGEIEESSFMIDYSLDLLNIFFQSIQSQTGIRTNITPTYALSIHKIVYWTIDTEGTPTKASGSVFVPKDLTNLPLISLHHGTQTNRERVGSVSPINAPEGLLGGTLGYYAAVPDYLGLGESTILHPYQHAKTSATSVIDFIRAAQKFAQQNNIQLNEQLFLAGYSEGGYVTLAAHKEIEENYSSEFTVTASAPMAGSYDLDLTARSIIQLEIYV